MRERLLQAVANLRRILLPQVEQCHAVDDISGTDRLLRFVFRVLSGRSPGKCEAQRPDEAAEQRVAQTAFDAIPV